MNMTLEDVESRLELLRKQLEHLLKQKEELEYELSRIGNNIAVFNGIREYILFDDEQKKLKE